MSEPLTVERLREIIEGLRADPSPYAGLQHPKCERFGTPTDPKETQG